MANYDFSKLSNEELFKIAGLPENNNLPNNSPDFSKMSNEELLEMAGLPQNDKSSMGKSFARGAKDIAAGVVGGVPDLAALPYYIYKGVKGEHVEPISEKISNYIDEKTGNYTKAHTPSQKVLSSVIQGVAGIPGFGLAGKLAGKAAIEGAKHSSKIAEFGKEFLKQSGKLSKTNIAGTASAAGLSQHAANVIPDNAIAPFIAGMAGSALGSRAGNFKFNGPSAYLAEKIRYDPKTRRLLAEANIEPTMADVSLSKSLKRVEDNLHHGMFTASTIAKKKANQINQIRENLGVHDFENNVNPAHQGSEFLQEHIGEYKKQHNQKIKAKETEIDQLLANLPEDKAYANVDQIVDHYENEKSKYRNDLGKDLLATEEASKFVQKLKDNRKDLGLVDERGIDAPTLRLLRQQVDDKISFDKINFNKEDIRLLKLRSDLTDALAKHAEVDPHLHQAWKETQAAHHHHLSKELPILNKYTLSKKNTGLENKPFLDIIDDLTNKKTNSRDFAFLRDKIIPQKDKLKFTQLAINQLGMKNGKFDLFTLKNKMLHKVPPENRDLLLTALSKGDKKKFVSNLEALDSLSIKEGNVTGSGHTVNIGKDINDITHATSELTLGHDPSSWIKLAGKLGATVGAAKLMTSKSLINKMDKAFNVKSPKAQAEYLRKINEEMNLPKYNFIPLKTASRTGFKKEESEDKKKLHIMMTPSKAYQIN